MQEIAPIHVKRLQACVILSFYFCFRCERLSPIKGGLQQQEEDYDGRLVKTSPSDVSRLGYCSMFLQCMVFFLGRRRGVTLQALL